MKFKTCLLSLFILIFNLTVSGQNKIKTIYIEQNTDRETYLVDFKEKGFLVVKEGITRQVSFFDNNLNKKWEVDFENRKFVNMDLIFHITDSGNSIFVITTGDDNSNFIKSISSEGVQTDIVKFKQSVHGMFCVGENLIVEISDYFNDGYSRNNESFTYLKITPDLVVEKYELKVPVIKYKGEPKYEPKWLVGGTSSDFYFAERLQITQGTEYVKVLKLNYDGGIESLRVPFNVSPEYTAEIPSKYGYVYGRHTNRLVMLTQRIIVVNEGKKRMFILRELGDSILVSSHTLFGDLRSTTTLKFDGMPAKYKFWNTHFKIIDGEVIRADLLFLMEQDSFELFSYSVNMDGSNLKEKRISFRWAKPLGICYGSMGVTEQVNKCKLSEFYALDYEMDVENIYGNSAVPLQFDILTLSEFGALEYLRDLYDISGNDYGYNLKNIGYLKRQDEEILMIKGYKQTKLVLFEKK